MPTGKLEWGKILEKLSPYTIQKGFRYLKHYGPKEFWIRLHERFEPEEVPYGPWYESYRPDPEELEKQKKRKWKYPGVGTGRRDILRDKPGKRTANGLAVSCARHRADRIWGKDLPYPI